MTKKEVVDRFLADVFDTVSLDLRQMLDQPRGLNFGIIILICSGIELMGALDNGNLKDPTKRFEQALNKYFPSLYYKYKKRLYNQFRCGIAHQAFIKPGTATARNPNMRQFHLRGVRDEIGGEILFFIHPDLFAEDFFNAIKLFEDSLETDPNKVELAYQAIEEIYRLNLDNIEPIDLYQYLPDDGLEVTRPPVFKTVRKPEVSMGSVTFENKAV